MFESVEVSHDPLTRIYDSTEGPHPAIVLRNLGPKTVSVIVSGTGTHSLGPNQSRIFKGTSIELKTTANGHQAIVLYYM